MLILRRLRRTLRRAIWVIILEQGKLYPFVPAAPSWRSGHMHLGLIRGPVMHHGVFLPTSLSPKLRKIDAVPISHKLIPLPLRRAVGTPIVHWSSASDHHLLLYARAQRGSSPKSPRGNSPRTKPESVKTPTPNPP